MAENTNPPTALPELFSCERLSARLSVRACGARFLKVRAATKGSADYAAGCVGRCVVRRTHSPATDIDRLTRERDEARAELAMAYTRALQAAAGVVLSRKAAEPYMNAWDEGFAFVYERAAADILALTTEDIERITQEHEHG